jgi:hypothetical protein
LTDLARLEAFLADWPHDRPILFVPGNHEFYDSLSMDAGMMRFCLWAQEMFPNIRPLDGEGTEIGRTSFFGGTMWTDFAGGDRVAMRSALDNMPDYGNIMLDTARGGRWIDPEDTVILHGQFMRRFRKWLSRCDGKHTVVVTHTAPMRNPASQDGRNDIKGAAYVCTDVEELLAAGKGPDLWLHGHTHECADFTVGRTRVVANQLGVWEVNAYDAGNGRLTYDAGFPGITSGGFDVQGVGIETPD